MNELNTNVIEFPVVIDCGQCLHHYEGPLGLFCGLWREEIVLSSAAQDCPEYEVY